MPGSRPSSSQRFSNVRSEEHTSELQSRQYLVCRLLLEKKDTREAEARRRKVMLQTLDSVSAHIAILSETVELIAVHCMWRAFTTPNSRDPWTCFHGDHV